MLKKLFSCLLILLFLLLLPCTSSFAAPAVDKVFSAQMDAFLASDENIGKIGQALERYYRKQELAEQEKAAKSELQKQDDQFKNPVKVEIGNSPVRGKADAKVTIVEFSDFQCPFCAHGANVMHQVLKAYPNDVKLVFKNLPLAMHEEAKPAARAAYAAGKQGKFWEMHDLLFSNQQILGADSYVKFAQNLSLDVGKFKADMESQESAKQVEADAVQATALGIQGTPAFFVNGVMVSGAQPFEIFKALVDRWLKK